MRRIRDLSGLEFDRLTVIEYHHTVNGLSYWRCRCKCGNEKIIRGQCLLSGESRSCGCLARELSSTRNSTHNGRKTRLYHVWIDMKQRCTNANQPDYPNWGGRGIRVCEEWMNSFESFRDWALRSGYDPKLSIDRIDVNGNYEPSNCRWITMKEQNSNRRSNKWIEYNGERHTVTQWSEILGGNRNLVSRRLKCGWSVEKALTTPIRKHKKYEQKTAERECH